MYYASSRLSARSDVSTSEKHAQSVNTWLDIEKKKKSPKKVPALEPLRLPASSPIRSGRSPSMQSSVPLGSVRGTARFDQTSRSSSRPELAAAAMASARTRGSARATARTAISAGDGMSVEERLAHKMMMAKLNPKEKVVSEELLELQRFACTHTFHCLPRC